MKNFFKFIFFLVTSLIFKKKRFLILNPNLSLFGIRKILIYDKKIRTFFTHTIRNNFDLITIEEIFFYESYKIDHLKVYKKILDNFEFEKKLIIDCGSNIGCSTNYFLRTFKNSKVISIEPDEDNFLLLSDNVKNQNAILINNAISNENFNFEIKDSEDNRAKSIVKVDKENLKKTLTINQILGEKENEEFFPFLIKIDIEGHEKDLFESNIEWFDKFQIVIIEIHDWMLPGESISKGYLNSIVNSMVENKRDTIIINENLISIKTK